MSRRAAVPARHLGPAAPDPVAVEGNPICHLNIGTDCRINIIINPSARSGRGRPGYARCLPRIASCPPCPASRAETRALPRACAGSARPDGGAGALAIAGGDGTVTLALDALSQPGCRSACRCACCPPDRAMTS